MDNGKLEKEWVEKYYLLGNKECIRYRMQKKGESHLDNLIPNGEIRADLKS